MSNQIEFEGDQKVTYVSSPQQSKMSQWVITFSGGTIKNEEQAKIFLLVFAGLAILISLFLFVSATSRNEPAPPQLMDGTFTPRM